MSKITLPSVAGGYNLQLINQNFQTLASELNTKVLYRNNPIGESNVLETPVDANGKNIFNVNDVYATRVFIGGVEIGTGGGGGGIDPANFLLKVNNLSDVASTTTARANLGLGNVDNTSDASKPVSSATASALLAKQDTLVSATNIKTVNGNSLLGSGDIVLSGVGTVTSASIVAANGFSGSVATPSTTPAITLTTSLTGLLKGNGTAMSVATAGTDYVSPATTTAFTAQQGFAEATLTYNATQTWAVGAAQVAKVTLTGNVTFSAPTGQVAGTYYGLRVIQDGTGSRTGAWNSVFKFANGTAPTLSTTAGANDFFTFRSDGTNMYEQGRSQGVA